MITLEHTELALGLVERLLRDRGATYGLGPAAAVGIVQDGNLVGGIAYHNWDQEAGVIEVSMASIVPLRATRSIVYGITEMPFINYGVCAIICRVGAENSRALQQLERLSFTLHRIPWLRGRGRDEYVCVLKDRDWAANRLASTEFRRWYQSRVEQHGQERREPATAA